MTLHNWLLVVTTLGMIFGTETSANAKYKVANVWPEVPIGWYFQRATGVAVDKAGNIYMAVSGENEIRKFDSNGRLLKCWGGPGKSDGQFTFPGTIKVDNQGSVYVMDWNFSQTGEDRILVFTSEGRFLCKWGKDGLGAGSFTYAYNLAVAPDGNVFVAAGRQDRIQKFASDGRLITQWGTKGNKDGEFRFPRGISVDTTGNVYIADSGNHRIQKYDSSGKFLIKWGTQGVDDNHFTYPISIAFDQTGSVYVLDGRSVQKFTPDGEFLARWEIELSKPRGYNQPQQIAIDPSGCMYVACGSTLKKLDSNGHLVEEWGSGGSIDSRFIEPRGIAVDDNDNMYVTETQTNRAQKFDSQGKFLSSWSYPSSVGGTNLWDAIPRAMTTDSSGNVYVLAYSVQKFAANGDLIAKWGEEGKGDGQFHGANGICIGSLGNIYIADTLNHRVQKLTPQGKFIAKWGTEGTSNGQFNLPECITMDQSGNILVADKIKDTLNRVQRFDSQGKFITKWTVPCQIMAIDIFGNSYGSLKEAQGTIVAKYGADGNRITGWGNWDSDDSKLGWIGGMYVDALGCFYVTDDTNRCIKKFDSSGGFISVWPIAKPDLKGNYVYSSLTQITVDKSGEMYIAEDNYTWIRKLTPDGKLIAKFQMEPPLAEGEFWYPRGVAVDSHDFLYVADVYPNNWRVQKFDSAGVFVKQWAQQEKVLLPASYDYSNESPSLAVDNKGNTYISVIEGEDHFVCMSDANGRFIRKWGSKGSGDGQFDNPEGIAVDRLGNVYVCDRKNHRIQKFSSNGEFISKWGTMGSSIGEFHFPGALAVDQEGYVYVADTNNHRIQKFTSDGRFVTECGELGKAPGQFCMPLGIAVDTAGNVFVSDTYNHRIQKFVLVNSK